MDVLIQDALILASSAGLCMKRHYHVTGPGPIDPLTARLEDRSRAETHSGIDSCELEVASWTC